MDIKQKIAVYSSMLILFIIGLVFLIKGITKFDIILILIGIVLEIMGLLRFTLFKRELRKHEDE